MRWLILSLFVPICASLTAACINYAPVSGIYVNYKVRDAPREEKMYLIYTNTTARALCFGPNSWPSNGILINNGQEVSMSAGGRIFFLRAEQDYCPNCRTRVEPGQTSTQFLRYSSFDLPANLVDTEKKISLRPRGFPCH